MNSDPSINKTADQLIGDCINKMTMKPSKLIEKKELKMIGKLEMLLFISFVCIYVECLHYI